MSAQRNEIISYIEQCIFKKRIKHLVNIIRNNKGVENKISVENMAVYINKLEIRFSNDELKELADHINKINGYTNGE